MMLHSRPTDVYGFWPRIPTPWAFQRAKGVDQQVGRMAKQGRSDKSMNTIEHRPTQMVKSVCVCVKKTFAKNTNGNLDLFKKQI